MCGGLFKGDGCWIRGGFGRTIVVSYEVRNVRGDGVGKDCGEAGA